jgi:hypothetical protein
MSLCNIVLSLCCLSASVSLPGNSARCNEIILSTITSLSSYKGEAIRKLASELYLQVVNEKREQTKFSSIADNNIKQPSNEKPISAQDVDEPLKVLKIRFAKGEITKEQYEEMRKTLEF